MGGLFGCVSKQDCVNDLFYGLAGVPNGAATRGRARRKTPRGSNLGTSDPNSNRIFPNYTATMASALSATMIPSR